MSKKVTDIHARAKDAAKRPNRGRKKSNEEHICELCNKKYKTERGILFHMCKNKQRLNEKEELHSRIGFMAYIKFFQFMQRDGLKKKPKTFTDFIKSPYYSGFIAFGHYVADMKMKEPEKYIEFLIKNNVPLNKWNSDTIYEIYVSNKIRKEKPDFAIEKSIHTMEKWAQENGCKWSEYFEKAGSFRIISNLRTGKISPWILYNTTSGKRFLNDLDSKDLKHIYKIIDPDFWRVEFKRHRNETKAISSLLKEAGL